MERKNKKEYLITLIKQSELPTLKLNTLRMQWEDIDLDKVADFLLDNGVDIVNPYSKLFESCLDINKKIYTKYNEKEFIKHFCNHCGTQRCEGIHSEWFEGCLFKDNLKLK